MYQFDEVGEGAKFGGEEEDGEVVVGDEAFGGTGKLGADGMEEPGTEERGYETGKQGQHFVEAEFRRGRGLRGSRGFS